MGQQGQHDRVRRRGSVHCRHFVAPPGQLDAGNRFIGAFIHGVVDFAAKRIQRGNGAAAFRRQEQEAVIKAGTALDGFFVGSIRQETCQVAGKGKMAGAESAILHAQRCNADGDPIPLAEFRALAEDIVAGLVEAGANAQAALDHEA